MHARSRRRSAHLLVLAFAAASLLPALGEGASPEPSLASGGLDGSTGTMQAVTLPARVSRILHVPGTGGREAWAIGHMSVARAGWDQEAPQGQIVFLHYEQSSGWELTGPPADDTGEAVNPSLANISLAPGGEGWAVGPQGAMVHHVPGGGWVSKPACPGITCNDLIGVSLGESAGRIFGYAVGSNSTVLKLSGGVWQTDSKAVVYQSPSPPELVGVAAISEEDAWAVGNSSSRELQIFKRGSITWDRMPTKKPIFDSPAPSTEGSTVNLAAVGTSMASTPGGGSVWIAGGIYPLNTGEPLGEPQTPFTILTEDGGANFTTHCPVQYALAGDNLEPTKICDKAMPVSPYDVTSISVLENGEVFAGGLGLFHFRRGVWFREPDAVAYLSSVSFAGPSEGWVATPGNTIGGGGVARSSSLTVGHYTSNPQKPRVARWPHFDTDVLQGVALSPDGRKALAVGNLGTSALYRAGVGWDRLDRAALADIRAVAWSAPNEAWAVGERGVILRFDGNRFRIHDFGRLTSESLFGIAFRSSDLGYAVGAKGTILVYQNGAWRKDVAVTSRNLYDVAVAGGGFAAAGERATLLVNPSGNPGAWSREAAIEEAVRRPRVPLPTFYAVDGLPDGTLLAGGSRRSLVRRDPGGPFGDAGVALDGAAGTILDLQGARDSSGRLHVFASVSPDRAKYQAETVGASRSTLMYLDGSRWRDLQFSRRITTYLKGDTGAKPDPMLALALDPSGRSGWAVGGTPANLPDEENHLSAIPTGSVYRFDVSGDPAMPASTTPPRHSGPGFAFAFVSESGCGFGPCSISVGSGTTADEVALRTRDEINQYAQLPGGPKFVVFGGSMRSIGLPEDLASFKGYLAGFKIPVFAALGPNDLFSASAASGAAGLLPDPPDDFKVLYDPSTTQQAAASNRFYLEMFRDQYAPWGTGGRRHADIRPVDAGLDASSGLARTHYAFDYAPAGRALARFVVLDTSDKTFSKGAALNQNPRGQDQATWFGQVVGVAADPPLPTIVIMNVPTINPTTSLEQDRRGMLVDAPTFESQALSLGVSAVLTGFVRTNAVYYHPNDFAPKRVPFYVLGSGGAPLAGSKYPTDGNYHAWHLINLDPSGVDLLNPQARVSIRTIPVIESVALHAPLGLYAPGGATLVFRGLARGVDGGGPPGHADQANRTYMTFPLPIECPSKGQFSGGCMAQGSLRPDYHFVSEDPSIADFVKPGLQPGLPDVETGFITPDDQSGLLCTFRAGSTHVKIVSGIRQMRMPVTVGAGFGPCVQHPVLVVSAPPPVVPQIVEVAALPRPLFHPPTFPEPLIIILPPAPGPIPAPAPPASAAGARKEEEEYQHESEGQEGDSQFSVLVASREQRSFDPILGWLLVGSFALMGMMGAIATATIRRDTRPIYVRIRRD